jgi:hypothetical protein
MAKIKLSAIVSEMRGKLNGSVFSKNRGGAYLRTKVTPVNPNTSAQSLVRATLASISATWRTLTQLERDAWNSAVSSFTYTDIFGDIKTPSGINLYNKLNLNLATISATAITTPPVASSTGYVSSLSFVPDSVTPDMLVTYTKVDIGAPQKIVIEATAQCSMGINFAKSAYRIIEVLPGNTLTGFDIYTNYTARFGALVPGQKIFIRIKAVNIVDGISGQYTSSFAEVV